MMLWNNNKVNNKELYHYALYLTLIHKESKLHKYEGKYFTLWNTYKYKCIILKENKVRIKRNNKYDIDYFIIIKEKYKNTRFVYDYDFYIIPVSVIRSIIELNDNIKMVKGLFKSYYELEYNTIKKNGKILKLL